MEEEKSSFIKVLKDYNEKCSILKQIHSNKKTHFDNLTTAINVLTIIASLVLTVIGFINKDLLYELFMEGTNKVNSLKFFDFIFNCVVLLVLIVSILNLILRYSDKSLEHHRSVILLSNLIREIKEHTIISNSLSTEKISELISKIEFKYSTIIDSIPPHSDEDFLRGKEDYLLKKRRSNAIDKKYNS